MTKKFSRSNAGPILVLALVALFTACSGPGQRAGNPEPNEPARIQQTKLSADGVDAAEPAIAADAQANIFAAYVEYTESKAANLYLQKVAADLEPAGERVRINPEPGQVKSWKGDPPTIKVAPDGKIYVGWNRPVRKGDQAGNDLMLSVSSDGGKSFAAPVKVNDDSVPSSHGMHGMEVDGENVCFVWLDERYMAKPDHPKDSAAAMNHGHEEPNAELYFAVSKDGGKTFSKNKKLAADICPCCKVQTVVDKGKLYFSWRQVVNGQLRHIAVGSTGDQGETFAEPSIVSDDQWQLNACPVSGAPLAIANDGALTVAWYTAGSAGREGLYWTRSTDGGKTFAPRTLIGGGMSNATSVLVKNEAGDLKLVGNLSGVIISGNIAEDANLKEISGGDVPAVFSLKNSTFITYVTKRENGKREVWIKKMNY